MKVTIQAHSSSGGAYQVEFSDESGHLRVFCHCPAGVLQQMCKHKMALIKGDRRMLHDPSEERLLLQVLDSTAYVGLQPRIAAYEQALSALERELDKLKARERDLKRDFARELTFGGKQD